MDSDNSDDGFAKEAGEALEMDEGFEDSEDDQPISDEEPPIPSQTKPQAPPKAEPANIKGEEVQN